MLKRSMVFQEDEIFWACFKEIFFLVSRQFSLVLVFWLHALVLGLESSACLLHCIVFFINEVTISEADTHTHRGGGERDREIILSLKINRNSVCDVSSKRTFKFQLLQEWFIFHHSWHYCTKMIEIITHLENTQFASSFRLLILVGH